MKISILIGCVLFAFSTTAQVPQEQGADRTNFGKVQYCAMLKDGKMVLMKDNAPVAAEILLKDGSSVSKDGSIRRKDGTKISLSNGDCVDSEGNVLPRKVKSEKKELQKDEPVPGYQNDSGNEKYKEHL